jgi:trans-aconitate methyltransferase
MEGRLALMKKHLPKELLPKRILHLSCGIVDTTEELASIYPNAELVGIVTAEDGLRFSTENKSGDRISYQSVNDFNSVDDFDST